MTGGSFEFRFTFPYNAVPFRSLIQVMLQTSELKKLDQLIDEVSTPVESECELLREHLESARTYLLGSMTEEYTLSLRLANETLNCISDESRRHRAAELIADMLAVAA